jgi:hypothetical protein
MISSIKGFDDSNIKRKHPSRSTNKEVYVVYASFFMKSNCLMDEKLISFYQIVQL